MNQNPSTKQLWRKEWLSSINELTSLELQKQSWQDESNTTNPHWSYVEFRCAYFDDLSIESHYETPLKEKWVTQIEVDIISDWHSALKSYSAPNNDDYNHQAIVQDLKWNEIIELGMEAKKKLSEVINNEEIALLFEDIDYRQYL